MFAGEPVSNSTIKACIYLFDSCVVTVVVILLAHERVQTGNFALVYCLCNIDVLAADYK